MNSCEFPIFILLLIELNEIWKLNKFNLQNIQFISINLFNSTYYIYFPRLPCRSFKIGMSYFYLLIFLHLLLYGSIWFSKASVFDVLRFFFLILNFHFLFLMKKKYIARTYSKKIGFNLISRENCISVVILIW